MNTLPQVQEALALTQPLRARSSTKYIARVTPVQLLQITGLVSLGRLCLQAAGQLLGRRRLPGPRRGRPEVYAALTIWLTAIIQRLWQKSDEGIIQYLYDHLDLAIGLPGRPPTGGGLDHRSGSLRAAQERPGAAAFLPGLRPAGASPGRTRNHLRPGVDHRRFQTAYLVSRRPRRPLEQVPQHQGLQDPPGAGVTSRATIHHRFAGMIHQTFAATMRHRFAATMHHNGCAKRNILLAISVNEKARRPNENKESKPDGHPRNTYPNASPEQ
jgi:hypothetical protein